MNEETKKVLLQLVEWCGQNFERNPQERWLYGRPGRPTIDGGDLLDQIRHMGLTAEEIDHALQIGQNRKEIY